MEILVRFSPQVDPLFDGCQLSDDHGSYFLEETFLNDSIHRLSQKILY